MNRTDQEIFAGERATTGLKMESFPSEPVVQLERASERTNGRTLFKSNLDKPLILSLTVFV